MTHEPQPLIISQSTLEVICEKQVLLDHSICESRGITPDEFAYDLHSKRYVALLVEAGEMINETKTFKYWSNKRMDPKKLLEEAIDWLHFYCSLLMTDYPKKTPRAIEYDRAQFDRQTFVLQNETFDYLYINLLQAGDTSKMLAAWSLILEQLGYTEEDILNMYERKNSTNYVRIAEGY